MKVVIFLMAFLAIANSVSSSRIRNRGRDFVDIKRIRPRTSATSSVDQSSALNVLSHLAQSRALTPRRRNLIKRAGLPHALPLEPTPSPLPLEIIRQSQPERVRSSTFEDLAAYRPRPELRPQTVPIPTFDPIEDLAPEEQGTRRRPSNTPQRLQRPSVYSEDDTLYRSPEIPNESQSVEGPIDPPEYSQPEIVFEGDVPVYQDASAPNQRIPDTNVRPSIPQRTRHGNRPRYSAEVQEVRKPVVVRAPARRPIQQQQYVRSQEDFDFPRTQVQQIREPVRVEGQRIAEHETVQRPVPQRRPESFSTSRYRKRKPNPVQRYVEKAPIKELKKKKVNPYKLAPLLKDIKKDKRAVAGGAHLDQNGIEFVEEARKVEGSKRPDNRISFQIHGAQGPHSYRFGFDTGKGTDRQFRYEERDNYGEVKGRYGYYDNYGKLQVVNYSAHPKLGFSADVPH